ncbi:hypothetical protein Metev_0164 [Methanohalobium evestigatum Z-7303]|uniref:Uncharacterized protein n=1 Tax=Methanohalobium evestigatum (strain ATCC BAA-1072 / DSM 3721 / NBRC 107634 / OCM 161 / Z-7303) TaxID=644295 RepID=D7E673_METEZ|nr:hypothetical protein Metev_0164 [Methanohalobium evestigatum Z-7303]
MVKIIQNYLYSILWKIGSMISRKILQRQVNNKLEIKIDPYKSTEIQILRKQNLTFLQMNLPSNINYQS